MGKIRKFFLNGVKALMKIYVVNVVAPWVEAKFFIAWEEYQKSDVYKERLGQIGFSFAFNSFFKENWEQRYHLKSALRKNPALKWKIRFLPFIIRVPDMLEIAANSGFFENFKERGQIR